MRDAIQHHECATRDVVRVPGGFAERQHGREAGVGSFQQLAPMGRGAALEELRQRLAQGRPARTVRGRGLPLGTQLQQLAQASEELRLQRPDAHVRSIGGFVHPVPRPSAVRHVAFAAFDEGTALGLADELRHQVDDAVGDRRIHHLPQPRPPRLVQCGQDAHDQVEAAPAVVPQQVQRRHRPVGRADGVQRTGERDVVDVVPRGLRQRPMLAPARHSAVDQPRVATRDRLRPQPQALHDARAEAFHQDVGRLQQLQHLLDAGGVLEVGLHHRASPLRDVARITGACPRAVDRHHVGAHVRQQHAGEGPRSDARELDDPQVRERARAARGGSIRFHHGFSSIGCARADAARRAANSAARQAKTKAGPSVVPGPG